MSIGNDFLTKLSQSKIPELSRMSNALNSEKGFRVISRFRLEELINIAQPASPVRYVADVVLGLVGARSVIGRRATEFLEYLLEMNSSRVQSNLMDRVEKSQGQLEAEIRKLLQQITRVAAAALDHARDAKSRGAAAVEENLLRVATAEKEIHSPLGN